MLVDEAMKLTRRHFRAIFVPILLPWALVLMASSLIQVGWMNGIVDLAEIAEPDSLPPGFIAYGCLFMLFILLMMVFQWATYNVTLVATTDALLGADDLHRSCLEMGFRRTALGDSLGGSGGRHRRLCVLPGPGPDPSRACGRSSHP